MSDTLARLTATDLPALVGKLGFRDDDVEGVLAAARSVAACERDLAQVDLLRSRLVSGIGGFDRPANDDALAGPILGERHAEDVLAIMALVASAAEVAAFHRSRGVPDSVSWCTISDLGEQARVHRLTYGGFGLHTYQWLEVAWSGALYWLGRLQFNLQQSDGEWVISTHIPATGPLTPEAVDDSLSRARTFFARHFTEQPAAGFHCHSWLLDPHLAETLPPESNLARFQQRWRLYGEPSPGDQDVLFFAFSRRGPVDLDTLPRETALHRVILDRLQRGGHWALWHGRMP